MYRYLALSGVMQSINTIFILLLISQSSIAESYGDVIVSEVRSVYDGDTFKAHIAEWPDVIGRSISIRLAGIDTPEMRGKCQQEKNLARKAKQFTVAALRSAKAVELHNIERGKYFRIVADVIVDGVSLNEQLITNNLAVKYDGKGAKKDWCI